MAHKEPTASTAHGRVSALLVDKGQILFKGKKCQQIGHRAIQCGEKRYSIETKKYSKHLKQNRTKHHKATAPNK